jgi:hypothetical protein
LLRNGGRRSHWWIPHWRFRLTVNTSAFHTYSMFFCTKSKMEIELSVCDKNLPRSASSIGALSVIVLQVPEHSNFAILWITIKECSGRVNMSYSDSCWMELVGHYWPSQMSSKLGFDCRLRNDSQEWGRLWH